MSTSISALQRNASAVVRQVAASGIAEEITDRGRVVAVLAPVAPGGPLDRLRRAGLVRPGDPAALMRGVVSSAGLPPLELGRALVEQRDSER
jgi:antitoxin (DNA-binding transcriptional repressor) of toxin-antitoxin stability system